MRVNELMLTKSFIDGLLPLEKRGLIKILGKKNIEGRTGVVSIQTLNKDISEAAFELDDTYGIMTRVGLHCAPSAHQTLGTYPIGTIRFSFGWWNRPEDVEHALKALEEICYGI